MKRFLAATAFSCAISLSVAGVLMAGALDRQNVMPRSNPVTQSMIRVPGVVGQEQMPAMSAIQQAGLNVSVLEAKKLPKGMKGAVGMEGKVVSQTPGPGGLAMYGTAVTIYVWKPNAAVTESAAGATTWGTGSPSTSSGFSAFPGSSQGAGVPGQQAYPQGVTGAPMGQSSQPFQVQQYYYPGAEAPPQGQTTTDQQGMPPQDQQQPQPPTDPNMNRQGDAQQPPAAPPAQ